MAKKAVGGAYERRGVWFLRITTAPKKRTSIAVPWASSREVALERAAAVQVLADRLREAGHEDIVPKVLAAAAESDPTKLAAVERAVDGLLEGRFVVASPKPGKDAPLTFEAFAREWTSGELARRWPDHVPAKDSSDDARVFRKYVNPLIGAVPISEVTLEDVDRVMAALPEHLGSASRRHVAQSIHRVLALAVYPAKHLRESPVPRGWLPRLKRSKAFTFLYPSEDAALMKHTATPLEWRIFFGTLTREGMRRDELARLVWADLDLERGLVRLDVNKTDDPRAWALDPGVVRALARWKGLRRPGHESERVFGGREGLYVAQAADRLRRCLESAGVDRPELFERSSKRNPLRVHDLRASFVTVSLATGRSETWVSDRTGHRSSEMVNVYRRAARTWSEAGLGTFEALDVALEWSEEETKTPPLRGGVNGGKTSSVTSSSCANLAESKGFEPLVSLHQHLISNQAPSATRTALRRAIS
jgi:integrase